MIQADGETSLLAVLGSVFVGVVALSLYLGGGCSSDTCSACCACCSVDEEQAQHMPR